LDVWTALKPQVLASAPKWLIHGPPGCGKSTLALKYAKMRATLGKPAPWYRIYLTEETPMAELRGHYVQSETGKWVFKHGIGPLAWQRGAALIIDEIQRGSDDVKSFLLALADDVDAAVIHLPNGEECKPRPGFQIFATMNGDPEELEDALRSRFPLRIHVDTPNPEAIDALPEYLRNAARGTITHSDPAVRIDFRSWKTFAEVKSGMGEDLAGQLVFGDRWSDIHESLSIAGAGGPVPSDMKTPP
jgi:MoxR-like ATPase